MKLYKQEAKIGSYQILLPAICVGNPMLKYLPVTYGEVWCYVKNNYGIVLLRIDKMEEVVRVFLKKCSDGFPSGWEEQWREFDAELTAEARAISKLDLTKLSNEELWKHYERMFKLDQDMWAISIFIDTFDAGFDQPEIEKIATKHNLTIEEVQILLTPEKRSYLTEWEQSLHEVKTGKRSPEQVIDRFFYYGADYADFTEIDTATIKERAKNAEPIAFTSPLPKQQEILKKHNLKENPLLTFQILAQWRDDRKRLNFTGVYGLVRLLRESLRRQNIQAELANALYIEEAKDAFLGKLDKNKLAKRLEEGVLTYITENKPPQYTEGAAGQKEFNRLLAFLPTTTTDEIKGMPACKGYARGTVRIILQPDAPAAQRMQQGDILVTSMTRPEFVPLMKKTAAIVTDEGGISCHAAIIAREMNIPCIIGTKIATKVFKDGDLVEVDADKGIVRKVKK